MLRICAQQPQKWMRIRHLRSRANASRLSHILELHVVDESKVIVKFQSAGLFECQIHQANGALGLARSVRRRRGQEIRAEFIGHDEMRIKLSTDLQQWSKQIVTALAVMVAKAKVCPPASNRYLPAALIAQAGALRTLGSDI